MRIPAGLLDKNYEWFEAENNLFALHSGNILSYNEVPSHVKNIFYKEYLEDIGKEKPSEEGFKKWLIENYGRLDHVPDLDVTTGKTNSENVRKNFHLSDREIEVIKITANGDSDKRNCDRINCKEGTIKKHLRNIRLKLNEPSKSGLTRFAYENSLI